MICRSGKALTPAMAIVFMVTILKIGVRWTAIEILYYWMRTRGFVTS